MSLMEIRGKISKKKKIKLSFLSHKYKVASYIIEKAGKH